MRIAHFSDLHYAVSTLPEVDTCFTYAVDQAIARQAEVAVITGDTTDHALDAHSPALMALARQIRRLRAIAAQLATINQPVFCFVRSARSGARWRWNSDHD